MSMNTKEIVKPAIVLLLIAAVAAALLGFISEVTAAPIAAQEQKTLNEGMMAVMPEASSFEELTDAEKSGTITAVYQADNGGYVITTAPGGFGGAVNTMVGIGADGVITGVRVTGHAETPGLGAKATEPAFYEQFTGKAGTVSVTKDGGEIVPITSATITSRTVCDGTQEALDWVAANGGAN